MKSIFTFIFSFYSILIFAQSPQLQLISSGGARFVNNEANMEVNTSIGESVIGIFESNGIIISNGFNQPAPKIIYTISSENASCKDASDAWVLITVTSGEAPFKYEWSNGANTDLISNLTAGIYSYTITDATSQKQMGNITITEPLLLVAEANATEITCNSNTNGTVLATANGGTSPYSFVWTNGLGSVITNTSALSAGTYSVEATDAKGCISNADVTVSWIGPCNTKVRNADCGTTALTFSKYIYCDLVSGATDYEWEFTSGTFSFAKKRGTSSTGFYLSWITGVEYAKTYDIRVRTFKNGVWGNYSSVCQVTTPAIPSTQLTSTYCDKTVNSLTQYIYCTSVPFATDYIWEFTNAASGYSFTRLRGSVSNSMSLTAITGLQYSTTYNVKVKAVVGSQEGSYGNACEITTPSIPTTKLQTAFCGTTLTSMSSYFYCDPVFGATNYEWEFSNSASGYLFTVARGLPSSSLSFAYVTGAKFGTTYDVRVRAQIGSQWGAFNSVCQLTTPNIVSTKVNSLYCGTTVTSLSQFIYCDAVKGAQDYEWNFSNSASSFSFTIARGTSNSGINLAWITNIANGTTYDVMVRAKVGTQWGTYGAVCQITTPSVNARENSIENQKSDINEQEILNNPVVNVELSLIPNPVRQGNTFNVNITSNSNINKCKVSIYNILGQLVYINYLNINSDNYSLLINQNESFSTGLHFIQTEIDGKSSIMKLIVD